MPLPGLFSFSLHHCVHQSTKSFYKLLTFPSVILTSRIVYLHFFYSLSFTFPPLSFKLLICFGSVKWIPHRWPNFSVDFLKLISCCILVWIPNEYCGKIGKSLIRWNGKILFFSPSLLLLLSVCLSYPPLSILQFVMDGYSLFCGLLTRVKAKFLICHTCPCTSSKCPGVSQTQMWSQTQTWTTTQPNTNTKEAVTNMTCVGLHVSKLHTFKLLTETEGCS